MQLKNQARGLTAFALVTLTGALAWSFQPKADIAYSSPDGALWAMVRTDGRGESRVSIEDSRRHVLFTRANTSADGLHGYRVVHGAWTPDSLFFVAGLESSGGHQPWSHPIWIYSRAANRVSELGALGLTPIADFRLLPPDILETQVLEEAGKGLNSSRALSVGLKSLLETGRAPMP